MSISRIHHPIFSLTTAILTATHCLGSPLLLLGRNEGTFVLSVNSAALAAPKSSSSIIPGWSDATAIVFFVAVASLFLTVPMFVYIWMRRRRLHAARQRSGDLQGVVDAARKGSVPLVAEVQLVARKESVGVDTAGESVESERGGPAKKQKKKKGSVRFMRPVQVSVKPTRAVEIMVKPAKVAFRDPTWEKLKS